MNPTTPTGTATFNGADDGGTKHDHRGNREPRARTAPQEILE
jgi:hypothetical protein